MKKDIKAVLIALGIVFVLSLASVFGQGSDSKPMNGDMAGMMNTMDMGNMMGMMKDMGMSDEMIAECQEHMGSGMMGGQGGMSQEEHESHHSSS